jgi:putative endonuclease
MVDSDVDGVSQRPNAPGPRGCVLKPESAGPLDWRGPCTTSGMVMPGSPSRPSKRALGKTGETAAARFLERRGLVIVARNLRSRLGEIDLLARDGSTLVFVEVKTRRGAPGDPPEAAVDARKRARLSRLALGYLAARRLGERSCRFDVVGVMLTETGEVTGLRHLSHAFDLESRMP